jgi:hypothetical protein
MSPAIASCPEFRIAPRFARRTMRRRGAAARPERDTLHDHDADLTTEAHELRIQRAPPAGSPSSRLPLRATAAPPGPAPISDETRFPHSG